MQRQRMWCLIVITLIFVTAAFGQNKQQVNPKIWSKVYWQKVAKEKGVVAKPPSPSLFKTVFTGSKINSLRVLVDDSPDVVIPPNASNNSQSENSIFVDPNNPDNVLNSNNSSTWPVTQIFGTSGFTSADGGQTWAGQTGGTGGNNSGDPAAVIDLNGRYYVGYIAADGGQGVAYSTDQGATWTHVQAATGPSGFNDLLDKNHLWVDNSPTSFHSGNLYNTWTRFETGSPNDSEIEVSRSTDGGLTWSAPVAVSSAVNAGSHNQGVNIQTAPNGEVYVVWTIYDAFPANETALGFSKSTDGGVTWSTASRIITNINGIRNTGLGGGKTMRVSSFPSMTVDPDGNIYIVWTNQGVPGVNTGDPDTYVIKSTDGGASWGTPVRVNQDAEGNGKDQWSPWIAADPASGQLVCIYYDSRNFSANDMAETFVAVSRDGGATWEDFKVSDIAWSGDGITGFSANYGGDYIGIDIQDSKAYPVWTDFRSGVPTAVTSPFTLADPEDPNPPSSVSAFSDFNTPTSVALSWTDPITLVNGTLIGPGDFTIEIERDGTPLASVPGGTQSFIDNGTTAQRALIDGQLYSYSLFTKLIANDSTSLSISANAYAGGAPTPAAPTGLACSATETSATLSWTDPATQIDGTTLDDLDSIRVYRDGALVGRAAPGAQSFVDTPPLGFTYTYTVTAVDNESPKNESAASNGVDCFVGSTPNYLVWVGSNAGGSAPASGDSLFQALINNGESAFLSNNLFEFGSDLSTYKAVFVVLGVWNQNHILAANSAEALALETYLQNGGCVYMEGADCYNYDPESASGHNIRTWFGLNDGNDGGADVSGVNGLNDLSTFSFAYSGDNNFMDELVPNGSTTIWQNNANTDISGVFYNGFGTGRAIGVVPEFGGMNSATAQSKQTVQRSNLPKVKGPVVRKSNRDWFVKKAAYYPERKANRPRIEDLLKADDGSVTILANTQTDLLAAYLALFDHGAPTSSFGLTYNSGWNLIGLPLHVADSSYQTLYPDALTGTLFSYNGSYQADTALAMGEGYWLNFGASSAVSMTGVAENAATLTLAQGWNLISPPSCNIDVANISDPGGIIIPGTFFGFNGAYVNADTLEQGLGYWVNTTASGQITLTCVTAALAKGAVYAPNVIAGVDLRENTRLVLQDADGAEQTLYYNIALGEKTDRRSFSLPPVAPHGFDARFAGDMRLSEGDEALIKLQADAFPVTVRVENLSATNGDEYVLEAMIGNEVAATYPLRNGGSIEIANESVNSLRLTKLSAVIPTTFAVDQNYPNPFNPTTEIRYALPEKSDVQIVVYNTLGQKVRSLLSAKQEAGFHTVTWNGANDFGQQVASGIYLYRVTAGRNSAIKKMILLK